MAELSKAQMDIASRLLELDNILAEKTEEVKVLEEEYKGLKLTLQRSLNITKNQEVMINDIPFRYQIIDRMILDKDLLKTNGTPQENALYNELRRKYCRHSQIVILRIGNEAS